MSTAPNPTRLIGYIFIPIGVVLLGVAVWLAEQRREILNTWPEVQAEVTHSDSYVQPQPFR